MSVVREAVGAAATAEGAGGAARSGTRARGVSRTNPFPGLRPFREDEEHLFFGRESRTDAMVDRLAATRLLAVIGSSGCGKSSLVNCGLQVALRAGLMAGAGTAWRIARMRPGGDPIAALARALAADGVLFDDFRPEGLALEAIVEANLRMSRLGLVDVCAQARLPRGTNLLLVVDQFEELFRYRGADDPARGGDGPDEAAGAFVNLLLEARRQRRHPIHVVLTMRADFLGDCARLPGLAEAINEGQYLVPRLSRDERRLAIAGPVAVAGGTIRPVLLTRLLNDLGDDPDRLPLLQHALNRLWSAHEADGGGGALDLRHYAAVGSLSNALDRHLEEAYAELGDERRRGIAAGLFRALTDRSTDPRGVRRPTPFAALCALCEASAEELGEVVDVFRAPGRSFLMPPAGEALEPSTMIDISHESLMRQWRRLGAWADEEALSARTYRRLAQTAALHERGEASLWRDPELELALAWRERDRPNEAWASRYGEGFERAMRFVEASAEARERERARRREEAEREQELVRARAIAGEQAARIAAQERAARVQRTVTRVIVGALLVSLGLAFLAGLQTWSRLEAERERRVAEASRAAADAETARAQVAARLIADRLIDGQRRIGADELTVGTLSRVVAEDVAKARALWELVGRDGPPGAGTPVSTTFVNPRDVAVRVLSWTPGGAEVERGVVPPNAEARVALSGDLPWVARDAEGGRLVAVGLAGRTDGVSLPD